MRRFLVLTLLLAGGCALFQPKPPAATLRFYEESDPALPESRFKMVTVPGTQQRIAIDPNPQMTEKDLTGAKLISVPGGRAVELHFDLHGANKLSEMTTRMRGRYVVIFLDDRPIAAVLIDKVINNGEFILEGDLTEEQEERMVDDLNEVAGKKRDFGDMRLKP
jgi:preprotein translocase subunit SecD